jgi:hypothetical protein
MSTKTNTPSAAQILAQIKQRQKFGPQTTTPVKAHNGRETGTIERVNIPNVNRPHNWAGPDWEYYYASPYHHANVILEELFENFPKPYRSDAENRLRALLKKQDDAAQPPVYPGDYHLYRLLDGHIWAPPPTEANTTYFTDYYRIWEDRVMGKTREQHYVEQSVMGWNNIVVNEHLIFGYRAGDKSIVEKREFEMILVLPDESTTFYYDWDTQAESLIEYIRTQTGLQDQHFCFYGKAVFMRNKIDAIPLLFSNKVKGTEIHDPVEVDPQWFIAGIDSEKIHPEAKKLLGIW